MIRKATNKFKGVVKIALKEYNGSDDEYFFKIPSRSVAQTARIAKMIGKSRDDDMAQLRIAGDLFDGFEPDTSRGTTISFADFIEKIVPDIDEDSFNDLIKLAGMSKSELSLRDDVIIEE